MLNPSTATEDILDPTVTRCLRRAQAEGHARLVVANLFALRATDPRELYRHDDPVGPRNDEQILLAAQDADRLVVAWGVHGALKGRGQAVLALLREAGSKPFTLGKTKEGHPRHPLYVAAHAPLVPFTADP